MAEAVVSIALETLHDLLLEEGRLLSGVGHEVKALETQLKEIKCLLEDADRRRHESKAIANWIAQVRNLAYTAEDVIETYAAQVSSKRGRGLKKLLKRFSSALKEWYSLHQLGSEISQLKSELERVGRSMQEYGIRRIIQGETSSSDKQQWQRQTFPNFEIEDCFAGHEDELKRIVSLAVDDHADQHRVVSLWGMGGIGKTTIARKVYNHTDTQRFFQSFAWVCITQQCQIRSVLEDVLRQLNPLKRDVVSSLSNTELIEQLCQTQKAKRCIIVLDDLWETDHWEGLKHAFLVQDLKSKILVTTRKQRVAEIGFPIQLGLLSIDDSWELLKNKAFPPTNIPDFAYEEKSLVKIGKEMVHKCGCLPLAISLLGGVLSKRKSIKEWELVKENINAYLYKGNDNEKEKKIHAVLNLSYEDLPYYLKSCFLYMGLYKEDEIIFSYEIYCRWIAQGMVSPENREQESLIHIAELYLSELASRSIVQVEVDHDAMPGRKYRWCKLHDVVRELCLSTGKREGFGLQSLVYQGGKFSTLMHQSLSGMKTRHLAIHFEGEIEPAEVDRGEFAITGDEDTSKHVRSLLLLNDNVKKTEFLHIAIDLHIFKLLRVVHFVRLRFAKRKLPKGIGNLIHLRCLILWQCELDELPSSIRNLSYLQTLDLDNSSNVKVPNVLKNLFRLKHLFLPPQTKDKIGSYLLELDEGLDELETLFGFDSSMHQLKSITRMKNLRSFGARVRDNESLSAVIDAVTTKWKKLQFGSVIINQGCQFTSTEEGLMVFKKVFTCPNLHQLAIRIEIGKRLHECRDNAISSKLVRLYLMECKIEDDPMEILGKLPVLKILHLWPRSFVGEEMTCRALCFPRLKELELNSLPNLREWRVEKGAMPLLSETTITYCPHLIMVPDGLRFIATLQKLTITGMPGLGKRVLASGDGGGGEGEDFDKVRHVPSIIINDLSHHRLINLVWESN